MASKRGFTQVEILVAVGVLAVGLLAVMGVLALGLRSTRQSQARTQAVARARQVVELVRARDWAFDPEMQVYFNDSQGDRIALEDPPFEQDFQAEEYTRNLNVERLSSNPASFEAAIARIRVRVYYQDRGQERQVQLESLHRQR